MGQMLFSICPFCIDMITVTKFDSQTLRFECSIDDRRASIYVDLQAFESMGEPYYLHLAEVTSKVLASIAI
jgi:hypothetical protein